MRNFNEEARAFYESFSREELKELLIEAGFEVEDGAGEVIFTESLETEVSFKLSGSVQNSGATKPLAYKKLPKNFNRTSAPSKPLVA